MTPAVFLFGIACVLIQNVESELLVCPKHKTGQVDGEVSIECKYSTVTKANKYERKYCCLGGAWSRKCKQTIVSTTSYVHQDYRDRASIKDNRNEGSFVFTLRHLEKTDQHSYVCGLGTAQESFQAVIDLVIIEDSKIPTEANLMYGQLWGTVKLPCEFGEQHSKRKKYLCKVDKSGCTNVIDSSGNIDNKYTARTILQVDEKRPGSFTVQIIQLRIEDSGMYSCGVGDGEEDTIDFDLRINEDQQNINGTHKIQGPRLLRTRLGGSVSALCYYDPKKNLTLKFWCKLDGSSCTPLINTDGFVMDGKEGKLLIRDDPTNGRMQVLMNQISKADEGWYWCVQTDGKHDQTSAVQIKISEDIPEGLTGAEVINVKKGEMAKLSCSYPCRFRSHEKSWCKWNNNNCKDVSSNVAENNQGGTCSSQEVVLTIGSVSSEDDGWYWCAAKESGLYTATKAMWLKVNEQTRDAPNSNSIPRGGSGRSAVGDLAPPSVSENKHNTLVAAFVSVGAAVLVACAVFFIIRLKRKRNSDLVSVGSYRTNISMTDLDNDVGKENPAVIDTQETDISRSNDEAKIKKKGSQENLDYSSFLIYQTGSPNEENAA
ncbi:polymeric immunoglobulin receptor-like [Eleutherodactylus coqui]|uniref:polymeric immunoglobulin receptor-like n=1 Tax=Eleutherodactylus coqui TaxID=57060 RepID=UPI0034631B92